MKICQLKKVTKFIPWSVFLVTLFASCTKAPVVEKKGHRVIIPEWGNIDQRFSYRDDKNQPVANPFYDIDPKIENLKAKSSDNGIIHYFVTTPEASRFQYNFDVYSGQLYRSRAFCSQTDVWRAYKGDLNTPNFTQGIVPRILDQSSSPLKIIIISDKDKIEPFKKSPLYFDEAKVLGSLVIQSCESYPCDLPGKWQASQILVGVNARDPKFSQINSFMDLKAQINWNYLKGMITNMSGVHLLSDRIYPATRIAKELNLVDTFNYLHKSANILSDAKLTSVKKWRESCFSLYDGIWDESQKIRQRPARQSEAFLDYFRKFYKEKSDEFYRCSQLVRPANVIENMDRHWFFSYLQAFVFLEKSGYYYSCNQRTWNYNPRSGDGTLYVDQLAELNRCRAQAFEASFDQAINGMRLMQNSSNQTFRFIEYDNRSGGSHQLLYAWIQEKGQNFICKGSKEPSKDFSLELFPSDVSWKQFGTDERGVVR